MKLLIVDDHEINLRLLRAKLETDGHAVVEASDGLEALEVLEQERVDGVVSDILMPRMDGFRLCMEVRSRQALAHLPFVFYTSTYNSPADRTLAESLGADAYLPKPSPTANIVLTLEAALARRGLAVATVEAVTEPAPLLKEYNQALVRKLEERSLELERAQEGLLESEARLSGLIASAMDAIVTVDESHRVILFNEAAGRMFGCDARQALGRSLSDFIPMRSRDGHQERMLGFADESLTARLMGPRSVTALRSDGNEFPIEANISSLQTSRGPVFTAFIRDVTERRRAEAALHTSEAGLRRAQDLAGMGHAVVNAQGDIESQSDSLAGLLGSLQPLGTLAEFASLVHAEDEPDATAAVTRARSSRTRVDFEYRILRNGEWRWIRHILEPLQLTDDDEQLRTFNTIQDVTAQRQAEQRIRQLNRVYAVLSEINSLIVRVSDRDDLFRQTCAILVETGGFSRAWIGLLEKDGESLEIVAWAGDSDGFFLNLQEWVRSGNVTARGMLGRVLDGQAPVISNDIADDPQVQDPTRLTGAGSHSLALLPLVIDGRTMGMVSIHSPSVGVFNDEETTLLQGLADDISFALDHLLKSDRISYLANHDVLTGLPSRPLAVELLGQHIAEAAPKGQLTCAALVDLVRFRRVNETLGRRAGDELLMQVAARLRSVDSSVARLGPDLFLLQLCESRSPTELARVFESIASDCFTQPFQLGTEQLRMGCRIGAAVFPDDGIDAETLLRNAEAALRNAREAVEPFVFYTPAMNATANEALAMESRLRSAIDNDGFVLHYQPKLRLADRRICGVEALLRWQDPEQGLVPPLRFIPILEETGLINAVGRWALRQALRDLRAWDDAGAGPIRMAVNVSALQLNQASFSAQIGEMLDDSAGVSGDCLELEITESVIMTEVDRKIAMLREIRNLGVHISVDDFGTGYSSLAYISRLPINALKIERAFVTGMTEGREGYVLVSSIIVLAHALNLTVVAEGVETEEQASMLQAMGCDEAQGYLFSRPVPATELLALLLAEAPGDALP